MDNSEPETSIKDPLAEKDQNKKRRRRKRNNRNAIKVNGDDTNSTIDDATIKKPETDIEVIGQEKISEKKRAEPNKKRKPHTKAIKASSNEKEKITSVGSIKNSEDNVDAQNDSENKEIIEPPKKRGRPKKVKTINKSPPETQSSNAETQKENSSKRLVVKK
jgi:hypothetical protein